MYNGSASQLESVFGVGEDEMKRHNRVRKAMKAAIWVAYNKDVFEHGTPTSCKRLIDVATCLWNKCMGNVDTIRKVVSRFKAQRGKECGPGSLYWFHLMDYIFYQAFLVHQHSCIEDSIPSMESHKQYLRKRKREKEKFEQPIVGVGERSSV
jgi:hypothetical protein